MYQDKNGWTPISEALPIDGEDCFVWYIEDDFEVEENWDYCNFLDGHFNISGVTHWRPIFNPPIIGEEKCRL